MLFEPGQGPGYEPPSKKSREGPESRSPDPGPLDCSKPENNGADLRIRQVRDHILISEQQGMEDILLPDVIVMIRVKLDLRWIMISPSF